MADESLAGWIDTLKQAAESVADQTEKVVSKGALNVKKDAKDIISGRAHLPHYPNSITYDIERAEGEIRAQIGPDKEKRQGPLGNILEYGSVNNAPIPHLSPALDLEEPRFERALADLGETLLSER